MKRWISVLLIVASMAVSLPAAAQSAGGGPLVFIRSSWTKPDVGSAGGEIELFLELHNVGDAGARQVVVSFSSQALVPIGTSNVKTVPSLQKNEHGVVSQKFSINPGLKGGTYPVQVTLDYEDVQGNQYQRSEEVGVRIAGENPTPIPLPLPVVTSASTEPEEIVPGEPFTMTLTIGNVGEGRAYDVLVYLSGNDGFAPWRRSNVLSIGDLPPGGSKTIAFPMVADSSIPSGPKVVSLSLSYGDETGQRTTSAQSAAVIVASGAATILPFIEITGYKTTPPELTPGEVFELTVHLKNSGSRAHQVALFFDTSKSYFAPLGSGNRSLVQSMNAGEEVTLSKKFMVSGQAEAGVYSIPVDITFLAEDGKSYQQNDAVTCTVEKPLLLQVHFYQQVSPAPPGAPFHLPVELINIGNDSVNLTTVSISSDDLEISEGSEYVGALSAGDTYTLNPSAVARHPGEATITVTVNYIDSFNRMRSTGYELKVTVPSPEKPEFAPGKARPGGEQPKAKQEKHHRPWYVRLIRGLLGLGGGD